jgi:hypothetical protein
MPVRMGRGGGCLMEECINDLSTADLSKKTPKPTLLTEYTVISSQWIRVSQNI